MRVCDFRLSSGTVPFPSFLSLFPSPGPDHFIRPKALPITTQIPALRDQ
jgi:hypothetical protein